MVRTLKNKKTGRKSGEGILGSELVCDVACREAGALLDACWDGVFPVRLAPVSVRLNVDAYFADMGDDLSMVVVKDTGKPAHVILNDRLQDWDRRVAWAHGLGHVVERRLAGDVEYSFEEVANRRRHDVHEFFAEEFAGALLMPATRLRQLIGGGCPPERVMEYFGVTRGALGVRWKSLVARHGEEAGETGERNK